MNELIEFTTDANLRRKPDKIAAMITELAEEIESTKDNLQEIKGRKWYQKLLSDNTGDLADAMIKQNDTISTFLNIVQYLLFLNMNNTMVLGGIMEALNKQEKARGISGNKYINMAKDYLHEAINGAQKTNKKFSEHESRIEDITQRIIKKNQILESQKKLISQLELDITHQKTLDEEHEKKIKNLALKVEDQSNIDKQQDEKIQRIIEALNQQDVIDKAHTKEIESIKEIIKNNQAYIQELEEKEANSRFAYTSFVEEQKRKNKNLQVVAISSFVVGIAALVVGLLV